jgi:hypothetical protein
MRAAKRDLVQIRFEQVRAMQVGIVQVGAGQVGFLSASVF